MNARLLFILLAISLVLAFTRRYRKLGFSLSAVLLLLLVWFTVHQPQTMSEPAVRSSSSAVASMPVTSVQLLDLRLSGDGAPWLLSGSLLNVSAAALKSIELQIVRWDCPTATSPISECQMLWQGQHIIRKPLMAGGNAKLDERFYSHESAPRPQGVTRDQFTVTAAY